MALMNEQMHSHVNHSELSAGASVWDWYEPILTGLYGRNIQDLGVFQMSTLQFCSTLYFFKSLLINHR